MNKQSILTINDSELVDPKIPDEFDGINATEQLNKSNFEIKELSDSSEEGLSGGISGCLIPYIEDTSSEENN